MTSETKTNTGISTHFLFVDEEKKKVSTYLWCELSSYPFRYRITLYLYNQILSTLTVVELNSQDIRYDNVTLSPLLLPARVTNRSHSTYGSSARSDSHQVVFCPNSVVSGWEKLTGVKDKYI